MIVIFLCAIFVFALILIIFVSCFSCSYIGCFVRRVLIQCSLRFLGLFRILSCSPCLFCRVTWFRRPGVGMWLRVSHLLRWALTLAIPNLSVSQSWPLSQDANKASVSCSICLAIRQLHLRDGTVHRHGPRSNPCPGSNKLPLNGSVRPSPTFEASGNSKTISSLPLHSSICGLQHMFL